MLLYKLEHYGFRGHSYNLLKDYITTRSYFTAVNTEKSEHYPLLCGVAQGSVMAPLLFNLYVNEILKNITEDLKKHGAEILAKKIIERLIRTKLESDEDAEQLIVASRQSDIDVFQILSQCD